MKLITRSIILILFTNLNVSGQGSFYRNYDLPDKPVKVNLSEAELKENKAIYLNELKSKEIYVTKNDEIEFYFFYSVSILINDAGIIDKFNKIYIPINDPADLINLKCRSTQPGGKSIELYKGDMKTITEDNEEYKILALEGLEKNSVIEYFYLKRINVAYNSGEFLNEKYYVKNYEFNYISPENLKYIYKSYNGMPQVKDSIHDNRNFYTIKATNVEPAREEPYTTSFEKYPRCEFKLDYNTNQSSKKLFTYSDISKKVITNFLNNTDQETKVINKVYKKLGLEDKSSVTEKIFTIENYFKTEMGYIANPGELSLGDCINKKGLSHFYQNKLGANLLDKLGIKFEVVLTADREQNKFDSEFETYSYLDETLFYIVELKQYVDFNNVLYRFPNIPSKYTNQKGLFVKPLKIGETVSATNSFKFIEPQNEKNNYDNIDCDITLKLKGDLKVSLNLTRTISGHLSTNYRPVYHFAEEAKRKELLQELLKLGIENATTSSEEGKNFEIDDFKKYDLPIIISGQIETNKLSEKAGEDIIVKIGDCIGLQAELYQEQKRKYPIYMIYPHSYTRKITLNIPAGYTISGLEKLKMNIVLNDKGSEIAYFKSDYKQDGDKIIVDIKEEYLNEYYKIEQFEDFRKVINASADFNKVSLLVRKK